MICAKSFRAILAMCAASLVMALLGKYFLHENVTLSRWLGIALITVGVGFVATGPEKTPGAHQSHEAGLPFAHESTVSVAEDTRSER